MNPPTPIDPSFEDYSDLAAIARTLSVADTHLDTPPDDLFAGIEARIAQRPATTISSASGSDVEHDAPVLPLVMRASRTFPRRVPYLLGAAAAVLAAVIGFAAIANRDNDNIRRLEAITLSNNGLEPIGASSRATATLIDQGDGRYALDVDVSDLPAVGDGFLELWIIDTDVKGMFSLGPMHGSGRYALPDHVAPAKFPIVDVSVEAADGAPQHSGKSILRGKLTV